MPWTLSPDGPTGYWASDLAHSIRMDQFVMLCAWLFLLQSCVQLASAAFQWPFNSAVNVAANLVFVTLYAVFLAAFAAMHSPPAPGYIVGVVLYFAGYLCFAALHSGVFTSSAAAVFYHTGAWLFLIGSGLVMRATVPRESGFTIRSWRFSPKRASAAQWWGAALFAAGSAVFVLDAAGTTGNARFNVVAGLVLFVAGRVFFVRGSQTPRCSVFFKARFTDVVQDDDMDVAAATSDRPAVAGFPAIL